MTPSNLHIAWARLFFRALAGSGVEHVVLSPGSRSTPLALAAAAEPALTVHTLLDERSAAFFALGQARLTHRPSVLVCTSGTAGAHYLPAIIEASQSHTPLVAVTADRPWEAYDAAAAQTIDQVKLFGDHVRHAAELGLPDPAPEALRAVARIAAQAAHRARWPLPGPVHVNARFRKPLEPVDRQGAPPEPWEAELDRLLSAGPPRVYEPRAEVDPRAIHDLVSACARARRGLIVCGPAPALVDPALARTAIRALASATGFPVLVEATSQIRFGGDPLSAPICGAFDALLRAASFRRDHVPDLIVEIGAPPTSAGYTMLLAEAPGCPRFVLAPHGWNDPSGLASAMVYADPYDVAARVARELAALDRPIAPAASEWARAFARADARVSGLIRRELTEGPLTEGAIVHHLVEALPEGAVLVVGNSMPVRDLDTYAAPSARGLTVLHQRGASGIDGLLSGAAGARSVSTGPMALLLGDLSLLHDLGGLAAARAARRPLLVVVVQNDGGRIFEALPIARRPELEAVLEAHFTTPQSVEFSSAAAMFGLRHCRVETVEALRAGFAEGLASGGCTIVEAVVPPHDAVARRARLYRDVPLVLTAPAVSEAPGIRGHSAGCGAEPQPAEG